MLGVSGMLGDGGAAAVADESRDGGGSGGSNGGGGEVGGGGVGPSSGGFSEERIEESDRNSGGNRWPRQETLALLQIRSDMDVVFRDCSLKGPLWEEVSRKLSELGYHRSAKKCKEKFENVYKYHRRTKEGRSTKSDGKTYRFFDQLEALENQAPPSSLPPQPLPPRPQSRHVTAATPVAVAMPATTTNPPIVTQVFTIPSTTNLNPVIVSQNTFTPSVSMNPPVSSNSLPQPPPPVVANPISFAYQTGIPSSHIKIPADIASISTSSSTSSDEEPERRGKRKRKWGDFFQRLMSEVIEKQEEMQRKFLETLERRERERMAREEAWRVQEMARVNREHDLLVHERSAAAAKDAAVIQFLQKISDQQIPHVPPIQIQMKGNNPLPPPPPPVPVPPPQLPQQQQILHPPPPPQPQPPPVVQLQTPIKILETPKSDNGGGESFVPTSSSRWPKAEVEALIRLRTNMDTKYQENGPKGPLWEEISAAMRRIGYDRNAKRCKEKWENINKYFKKVKESNKKRPEDSKTCPYFQQLDVLYREKAKTDQSNNNPFNPAVFASKPPENPMVPIMVQPEQQFRPEPSTEDNESENMDQNIEDDEGDEEDDDDDDDDEVGGYEIVTNKGASVGTTVE